MEKIDLAKNTFIAKMPNWLRWLLFLPLAISGSVIISLLLSFLSVIGMHWCFRVDYVLFEDVIVPLYCSLLFGGMFVGIVSIVVPKHQRFFAITLLILLAIYSMYSYLKYLLYLGSGIHIPTLDTPWRFQMLFEFILNIVGGFLALSVILEEYKTILRAKINKD